MSKQYTDASFYEAKLEKVMNRLGVEKFNFNWDRFSCWVEFSYKGQLYRFEHSIKNAKSHGQSVQYGSDVFAQVVLALEDIARMTERGIYELSTWIAGLKALPQKTEIPPCFVTLQFTEIPDSRDEIIKRYKLLSKTFHPDAGGTNELFCNLTDAKDQALEFLNT